MFVKVNDLKIHKTRRNDVKCSYLFYSISRDNKVIIMSIHQPRYSIYKLFDSLTLMSHGRIVYHGPAANSLNYFSELGN